jgi:hypothetical protein
LNRRGNKRTLNSFLIILTGFSIIKNEKNSVGRFLHKYAYISEFPRIATINWTRNKGCRFMCMFRNCVMNPRHSLRNVKTKLILYTPRRVEAWLQSLTLALCRDERQLHAPAAVSPRKQDRFTLVVSTLRNVHIRHLQFSHISCLRAVSQSVPLSICLCLLMGRY